LPSQAAKKSETKIFVSPAAVKKRFLEKMAVGGRKSEAPGRGRGRGHGRGRGRGGRGLRRSKIRNAKFLAELISGENGF